MSAIHPRRTRKILAGAGIAAAALAVTTNPAAASGDRVPKPDQQAFLLSGTGELQRRSRRSTVVKVAATIGADDTTLPGPSECEGAIATLSVYGARGVDMTLIGYGQVCGHHLQPPTSIVTHAITGTYEVLDGPRRLIGTGGFFEVRLGANGTAGVFAIDT